MKVCVLATNLRMAGKLKRELQHRPGEMDRGGQGDNGGGRNESTSGAGKDGEGKAPPWKRRRLS